MRSIFFCLDIVFFLSSFKEIQGNHILAICYRLQKSLFCYANNFVYRWRRCEQVERCLFDNTDALENSTSQIASSFNAEHFIFVLVFFFLIFKMNLGLCWQVLLLLPILFWKISKTRSKSENKSRKSVQQHKFDRKSVSLSNKNPIKVVDSVCKKRISRSFFVSFLLAIVFLFNFKHILLDNLSKNRTAILLATTQLGNLKFKYWTFLLPNVFYEFLWRRIQWNFISLEWKQHYPRILTVE